MVTVDALLVLTIVLVEVTRRVMKATVWTMDARFAVPLTREKT